MSSFFTLPASQKKRKRAEAGQPPKKRIATTKTSNAPPKSQRQPRRDESISGSESDSDDGPREEVESDIDGESTSGSEGEEETAAERRLRLAERYLENIREEVDEVGFDAEDIDRDLIAERLKEDAAESKGRLYRNLAVELAFEGASHTPFRSNSETVTSIATCFPHAYTVSKDLYLIKWRLQDIPANQFSKKGKNRKKAPPPPRRRPEQVKSVRGNKKNAKDNAYRGHVDNILCVAASQDGKFVVTGGRDRRIIVWNAESLEPLRVFTQHRDAVTGLAFRRGTNQLYSSSKDRTIKVWSLDELAYIETLFGHQDEVVDITALAQERCISVGARDRTARLWKVVEETQLVFRGGGGEKKSRHGSQPPALEGSMDRVAMIDEEMFVTGGDNGAISLWVTHKKKPLFTLPLAHGIDPPMLPEEASSEVNPSPDLVPTPSPRWITALATIPYSDVILSGSWDGHLRAWRVSDDRKRIEAVGIVGASPQLNTTSLSTNGNPTTRALLHNDTTDADSGIGLGANLSSGTSPLSNYPPLLRGVINDISIFERGDRGRDGVCIVVAMGKEHRFGRWQRPHGKNGAVVFEVSRIKSVNGELNGDV
ncbi:MAG: pre-rRNA processing protein [Claussenomyces sp. TS43310]|nr:MAG: pre-rRNA processing protein [Claussenomyces sp. TS43310]